MDDIVFNDLKIAAIRTATPNELSETVGIRGEGGDPNDLIRGMIKFNPFTYQYVAPGFITLMAAQYFDPGP